ncbi:hypothetical protein JAAARDRAFT_175173 [Jaapia argillacea MUCL 33604]|uniref:MYND-type domain-containing protein n=1 Tax=Jaapia argillacea MUCL 33604 TaxID=933084 RepID=A0A067PY99_9AGAM|nr:hypothetical protein JAAARDRAFT_175173 [Jaapia argillacea MUCL 33604]
MSRLHGELQETSRSCTDCTPRYLWLVLIRRIDRQLLYNSSVRLDLSRPRVDKGWLSHPQTSSSAWTSSDDSDWPVASYFYTRPGLVSLTFTRMPHMFDSESTIVLDMTQERPCGVCESTKNIKQCARCKSISYCSKEHQLLDWPTHKKQCQRIAPKSGDTTTVTGILFPALEDKPRLVQVICKVARVRAMSLVGDGLSEVLLHKPQMTRFLGDTDWEGLSITHCGSTPLKQPIKLFIRDNFMNDKSPFNQSVIKFMGKGTPHPWAGNLLAMKMVDPYTSTYVDAGLDDLRAIRDYFSWYPSRGGSIPDVFDGFTVLNL